MRALIQRVARAQVSVDGATIGRIGEGLLVLLGCRHGDLAADAEWTARKVARLRLFEDERGLLGRSVAEQGGAVLVVPQFTLYGDTRRGRRPSFTEAMPPGPAEILYERFIAVLREEKLEVQTGRFRADMDVEVVNRGPVTLLVESEGGRGTG